MELVTLIANKSKSKEKIKSSLKSLKSKRKKKKMMMTTSCDCIFLLKIWLFHECSINYQNTLFNNKHFWELNFDFYQFHLRNTWRDFKEDKKLWSLKKIWRELESRIRLLVSNRGWENPFLLNWAPFLKPVIGWRKKWPLIRYRINMKLTS